ncbi:MAG: adenosine deaminase [Rhodobacterales bacterium]|nr:MAG: adenosine deaminase [Rhodobacterales bacterium]PIE09188.1 MAG: adenosine deaminase [Rhodobacterales bacterium]
MTLQDRKKIELHHHLEGAASPEYVRRVAARKGLELGPIFDAGGHYQYGNFGEFLATYEAATAPFKSPEDYADLTEAVLSDAAAHGVVYVESFLSPDFCGGRDVAAWRDYLAAMEEGAARAEAQHGITLRGCVTIIRHFGPEGARETARCAQETAGRFITGFGIAGDENAHELADFAYAFDMAREAELGLTAHAGEWRGADEVRAALALGVSRVGHGIGAAQDPDLMRELSQRGTVLEVCPGSNVALGAVAGWEAHPIEILRKNGVKLTVSTDDPPFFHTDMTREYEKLIEIFGWTAAEFDIIDKTALDAAFCDSDTRATIAKRLAS